MQLGADDYLVDSIQGEFADAIVDTFEGIGTTILDWHARGQDAFAAKQAVAAAAAAAVAIQSVQDEGILEVVQPDQGPTTTTPSVAVSSAPVAASTTPASENAEPVKFCMECGTKLQRKAKFCSSCGAKQPALE